METRFPTSYAPGLTFHLPQSSLKKIHAVVRAYFVIGRPATLEEVGRQSQQSQATIQGMQDFLVDLGILRGTSKRKQLRPVGMDLGKAIKSHKGDATINWLWKRAVSQSGFCLQVLRDARAEGKMDKNRFIYLIFVAAGYRPRDLSHDYTTGTKALISIFRRAGLVRRTNGYFTVGKAVEKLSETLQDENRKDDSYISQEHILCLEEIQSEGTPGSDPSMLLGYCTEINDNYRRGNALSVRLLRRAVLDHILWMLAEPSFAPIASRPDCAGLAQAIRGILAVKPAGDQPPAPTAEATEAIPGPGDGDCRAEMNFIMRRLIGLFREQWLPTASSA